MGEEWKQYKPYPSYWVNALGNVKRIYTNGKEHILKPTITHKGYGGIDLTRKPKRVHGLIHRMVAECFIENLIINHMWVILMKIKQIIELKI